MKEIGNRLGEESWSLIDLTLEQFNLKIIHDWKLVALLHDGFHQSKWTDQEIGFAMARAIPVCSVQFGEAPYGFIGRFQAFNGRNQQSSELAKQIFEAYRRNKQTKHRMAEA